VIQVPFCSQEPGAQHFPPTLSAIPTPQNSIPYAVQNYQTLECFLSSLYLHSLPKIHTYSTPHAIANFRGADVPSLHYEDPALITVPTFWINNAKESHFPHVSHPLFDRDIFGGVIPSMDCWHTFLEGKFRSNLILGTVWGGLPQVFGSAK
jgi:hypothetical protein